MCEPLSISSSAVAIAARPEAKRKSARAAFQIGNAFFVGEPGRIDRARVIVAFVFARAFLDVCRCGVNRRHDRAGGRVGLLTGVNGARGEVVLLFM